MSRHPTPTDPLCDQSGPHTAWTTNNIAEALPGVLTALTWTTWGRATEVATRRAYGALGILGRDELAAPRAPDRRFAAIFFGRPALNVDTIRMIADRAPGTSGRAAEEQLLGSARPNVPDSSAPWRIPLILARMPAALALEPRRLRRFLDEQTSWWRRSALSRPHDDDAARARLCEASTRLEGALWHHSVSSIVAIACLDRLAALTESAGRPDLHTRLATGLGGMEEQRFLTALWELSRGRTELAAVVADFGFQGPGELSQPSFRAEPGRFERIATRFEDEPDELAPDRVVARQTRDRAAALADLLSALPAARRPAARALARFAASYVPQREASKAAYVMGLDVARASAAALADHLVAAGRLADPGDVYSLTLDELLGPVEDFRALAADRVARREHYLGLELPVSWAGQPEARPVERHAPVGDATTLTGIGVFPGIVEAPARVARTMDEAEDVQPGDVLVCHTTDPSWSAVFPLAAGLAIDVGSHVSHGALVARELGIPCVINTLIGSDVIHTGDLVRLDGGAGTIELVEARNGR